MRVRKSSTTTLDIPVNANLEIAKQPTERRASPAAKILFLDGVRGAAVISVITQHSGYMHDIFLGAVGVDAFFVLSAFLLTMIFMKKSIKLLAEGASYHKWGFTLADYFSKRFFRVYPLFALVAIILWLMPFQYKNHYYNVVKPQDYNLFLTLIFHPDHRHYLMWTLPLEISYYFILPAFVLAVLKLGRGWWIAFIPLYTWVIHEGLYTTRTNVIHQRLIDHLPTFLAGSMAAVIFVKLEAWIKVTGFKFNKAHTLAIRVIEGFLIAAYLSVAFRGLFFNWLGRSLPVDKHYMMPFTSVKLSLLFVIEMLLPSAVSVIFEWLPLRHLGKICFSVYLLHVFIVKTDKITHQKNYYDRTFSEFGLVILLGTISYHLVEYPSQLLAQRLSREFARLEANTHQQLVDEPDHSCDAEYADKHVGVEETIEGTHKSLLPVVKNRWHKEDAERLPSPPGISSA